MMPCQNTSHFQRSELRVIYPQMEYQHVLTSLDLPTIAHAQHDNNACECTFSGIINDQDHKIRKFLPPLFSPHYNLGHARTFTTPPFKANRFDLLIVSLRPLTSEGVKLQRHFISFYFTLS